MSDTETPLRPGEQLASSACTVRVVVVRAPAGRRPVITCGGAPMVPATSASPAPPAGEAATPNPATPNPATLVGKRYTGADETLELLCTSSGSGELACDGVPMSRKAAKPLPASD